MTQPSKKQLRERYERHKKRVRGAQSQMAAAGQEIGPIPPIADPARRRKAEASLRAFEQTYFPEMFFLESSPDQIELTNELEEVAENGGRRAVAEPRGTGKSTRARVAALWAILTGRRSYVVLIGANGDKARGELEKIKTSCETNALLIADFPEVLYPILKLDRIVQRQKGQTYLRKHTRITWLAGKLVFPTTPGSKASGAVLTAAGLQGSDIRGQSHQTAARGKILRPDMAIVDDPQTRESAMSDLQCGRRETLLNADVVGMSGPGKKLAIVVCCTVIRRGDLADRLLDRKLNPHWNGIRRQMLPSLPVNLELWSQYAEIRSNEGDAAATAFYQAHRAAMDQGAKASWPVRFNPGEVSAVQHAMNLRIDDRETFASEYQNAPEDPADSVDRPTLEGLQHRLNRLPRGQVPAGMKNLVGMIDVQERALYWRVLAVEDDFTAAIVDRGNEPEQPMHYFCLREIQRTLEQSLAAAGKGGGIEAAICYGLECLTERLFTRAWRRQDGTELRIEKLLIDSGDQTKTIYKFCRESKWGALILPSKGVGITAGKAPIDKWKLEAGEKRGQDYVITSDASQRAVRLVRFDTNAWKTFVCRRAAIAGGKGSLKVYGDDPKAHRMLQDHVNAETCVKTTAADGRTVWEWSLKPGGPDNHELDTLVGCYVAAAIVGCKLDETREKIVKKKRSVTYF